ncbi:MAG TPA: sigma-70 family RNA polymerase sigma factor [Roseiflexaceae bacterium]
MVSDVDLELPKVIAQAQMGDSGAFGEIYAKYAGLILRYLYVRVRDQEGAQDLTQEVFVRVIKGIGGFEYRGEKSFLGWLYTIANNVLIGQARRKRAISTPLDESIEVIDPRGQEEVLSIYDRVSLQQAISQLTQDQQQVLTLKFFADMTNNEIATAIGRTEGAVKALQHRALQSLQQILAREGRETLLSKEYGASSESWSAWDEPVKSRSIGPDDISGSDVG